MWHLRFRRLTQFYLLWPPQIRAQLNFLQSSSRREELTSILRPPWLPFQHRRDCSLVLSQHSPGMSGKVNSSSPSGKPRGTTLAPHTTFTVVRVSARKKKKKYGPYLGNSKTHTQAEVYAPRHLMRKEGKSFSKLAHEAIILFSVFLKPSLMGCLLYLRFFLQEIHHQWGYIAKAQLFSL